ncbi:hypothetical protein CCHR01_05169 [Colletotrichum chrysophilum]|uniref:Uncharacterized protein n=1 Tax=Colletotrichum chrysophilum TaxID=1836956 RepID=A0AAD9EKZ3_9PEZI|nr:hypothetical protein CCHR01_05169 [Colletotrichum chrysophilum]
MLQCCPITPISPPNLVPVPASVTHRSRNSSESPAGWDGRPTASAESDEAVLPGIPRAAPPRRLWDHTALNKPQ